MLKIFLILFLVHSVAVDLNNQAAAFLIVFFDFGSSHKTKKTQKRKGDDIQMRLNIQFEDAINGKKANVKINKYDTCSNCKGTKAQTESDIVTCETCHGSGQVQQNLGFFSALTTCNTCSGTGQRIKNYCKQCSGNGYIKNVVIQEIDIPAGILSSEYIILKGFGMPSPNGGSNGDLIVFVSVLAHKHFKLTANNDLVLDIPISIKSIILEETIDVPTPYGIYKLKLNKNMPLNESIKLDNLGYPYKNSKKRSKLILNITPYIPEFDKNDKQKIEDIFNNSNDKTYKNWLEKF
ncbi:molecular chaperone DnaJ [Mycoplasma struthionis]|uniref:Chaperone protein DnaJ n=1 Tax=Mycoplasma struthionis TaxID=538220 RepID=A0A502M5T5_9MOLU|nr:molecular chaperone DnaJ [Mycoplasma struthionis]